MDSEYLQHCDLVRLLNEIGFTIGAPWKNYHNGHESPFLAEEDAEKAERKPEAEKRASHVSSRSPRSGRKKLP